MEMHLITKGSETLCGAENPELQLGFLYAPPVLPDDSIICDICHGVMVAMRQALAKVATEEREREDVSNHPSHPSRCGCGVCKAISMDHPSYHAKRRAQ